MTGKWPLFIPGKLPGVAGKFLLMVICKLPFFVPGKLMPIGADKLLLFAAGKWHSFVPGKLLSVAEKCPPIVVASVTPFRMLPDPIRPLSRLDRANGWALACPRGCRPVTHGLTWWLGEAASSEASGLSQERAPLRIRLSSEMIVTVWVIGIPIGAGLLPHHLYL